MVVVVAESLLLAGVAFEAAAPAKVSAVGVVVGVLVVVVSASRVWLLLRLQAEELVVPGWLGLLVVETEFALVTVDVDVALDVQVESSTMEEPEPDQLVDSEGGQVRIGPSLMYISAKPRGELLRL